MAKKQIEGRRFKSVKQQEEFESFCKKHITNLLECAKLPHFILRSMVKKRLGPPKAMEVEIDHKYLEIIILYDENYAVEQFVDNKDIEELLRTLSHEVSHIPTAEIQDHVEIEASNAKQSFVFERCTQMVSLWLYDLYTLVYIPTHRVDIKTGLQK